MKSAITLLKYTSAAFCIFLLCSFFPDRPVTKNTDGDKNKKEKIKELSYDRVFSSNSLDFEFEVQPKVKIYNSNDILVYEDNVASIEDIPQESLKKLFSKCNFLMENNNIRYYIIN
ncbi:hypothetical protein QQ020_04615 [Fulvivirgaceae bacterium BMA12]|uniref:Uncharacterized protein n=1 Tax=Agaribacillus aureus TaxID=3051825 RepID=A0ABT8L2R2_9BACT|nr:hypothetical protein [Fulvivirgaceae bacterium BMA12]